MSVFGGASALLSVDDDEGSLGRRQLTSKGDLTTTERKRKLALMLKVSVTVIVWEGVRAKVRVCVSVKLSDSYAQGYDYA